MAKTWATFEERVRELASYLWDRECLPRHVGGVDIDAALTVDPDLHVYIEITERTDLGKVREDVTKLIVAKAALLKEAGAFARCYCVVNGPVTEAMKGAGAPHSISVVSIKSFSKRFFDFS